MELTKDKCKNCTVENMCTTGTLPNSEECLMKGIDDGMLTKEECIEYLETIKNFACIHTTCCRQTHHEIAEDKKLFNACINTFEQLINEHFDNPPLKFEKLCEDEPIFDKKHCCWRYVMQKDYDNEGFYDPINDEWIDFEEDRFFAREVKE